MVKSVFTYHHLPQQQQNQRKTIVDVKPKKERQSVSRTRGLMIRGLGYSSGGYVGRVNTDVADYRAATLHRVVITDKQV